MVNLIPPQRGMPHSLCEEKIINKCEQLIKWILGVQDWETFSQHSPTCQTPYKSKGEH